uniref:Transposon Ty3-G Gag-Pol polyprotein n=1 Tax=Cajanus cajan TaxID=3821 RepID=A0A151RZ10_CAJCA|nr:Transposon Ty3-G Gag-Pol polyprotein [Cajanus cajan]KYP47690.1 Transposon Ty3-G Gag-Pol polyprotein [Cajanus cajan]
MKCQADKRRRDLHFVVGDLVLVKLQPYRQRLVALRKIQKLSMCYFGPFEVVEKIGEVEYKLQLPDTVRIHPVLHLSLLKKFVGVLHNSIYCCLLPLPLVLRYNHFKS